MITLDRRVACLATVAALTLPASPARGIVRRHDRDDTRYLALGERYPEVARVGRGAGTLIAPDWVLTAAHVVDGGLSPISGTIRLGQVDYPVERIVLHPSWVGDLGPGRAELTWVDMALVKLARPVTGVIPAVPYARDDEAEKPVVFAGRGRSGDGRTGPGLDDGRMRAAQNVVSRAEGDWLSFRFDEPPAGSELEGISGPGDSGGPALLEVDGTRFVIGVSSRNDHDAAGLAECVYGTTEVYTRVSAQHAWIAHTLAETGGRGSIISLAGTGWPETPAGKLAAAFFHAYNQHDTGALAAFARSALTAGPMKGLTPDEWATVWGDQARRSGDVLPVWYVEMSPLKLLVLGVSSAHWRSYRFELEGHEPFGLLELGVGRETTVHGAPLPDAAEYLQSHDPPEKTP